MIPLLATKLHHPLLPTKKISRLHLVRKLNAGMGEGHHIILVSAPAGFGKTTCITEWVDSLGDIPITWLSLDPADDDPGRFLGYFLAAIQKIDPMLGKEIESVLLAGELPPPEIAGTILINEVMDLDRIFVLVLDDVHVLQDTFILEFLENLVVNLPEPLYLVMITREDPPLPLAQLRGNNRLTEIRAKDLRFSHDDIKRFMKDVLGLSLSDQDMDILAEKTEGWIVGLQLAGLSMREQEEASIFIADLTGSHRHILGYLTEQVLDQQSEEIQDFLLQTSILDQLNGDLCNAVTGRKDCDVLLAHLATANLFLNHLDEKSEWYRFHHLFSDLLRNLHLKRHGKQSAEIHQRASKWFKQAGMASEAIQHALAAKDYGTVVDLLEKHAMRMIQQGFIKTVNGWAQDLPDEWALQSPKTNLAFAWMHLLRGSYSQASPYLERLGAIFGESKTAPEGDEFDDTLLAEWFALQSLILYSQKNAAKSKDYAFKALEILPQQEKYVRSFAYFALSSAYWLMNDFSQAANSYQLSIQYGRESENTMTEVMSTVGLAGMVLERGQLHLAYEIASQSVERLERSGINHPINAVVYAALADAYYQWQQVEESRHAIMRALQLTTLGGPNTVKIFCHGLLARLFQSQGDLESANNEIQKAVDLIPINAPEYIKQEVISRQVRVHLAGNHLPSAEMAMQRLGFIFEPSMVYPEFSQDNSVSYSMGLLYITFLYVVLTRAQTKKDSSGLETGIDLANRLISRAKTGGQLLISIEGLLVRAQIRGLLGNLSASRADYINALELAEEEGFIGIFVENGQVVADAIADLVKRDQLGSIQPEYVRSILDAFSTLASPRKERSGPISLPDPETVLSNPLTDRERDVLNCMAEGLKYQEIAERLYISQNTVRYHVKAIYGKLNVNNRTQAIEKARQLQII